MTVFESQIIYLNPSLLRPSDSNIRVLPREIDNLCESIVSHGILIPLLITKDRLEGTTEYTILNGVRRWYAANKLKMTSVPCILKRKEDDDKEVQESLVIDYHSLPASKEERINAMSKLRDNGMTHEEIAKSLGISRTLVTENLSIEKLPEELQVQLVDEGVPSSKYPLAQRKYEVEHEREGFTTKEFVEELKEKPRSVIREELKAPPERKYVIEFKFPYELLRKFEKKISPDPVDKHLYNVLLSYIESEVS